MDAKSYYEQQIDILPPGFTEADLVSFGNYLLAYKHKSPEQTRDVVTDSDLANWKEATK